MSSDKAWTQEDWQDLYITIELFKKRVKARASGSEVHQRECWDCHNIATHTSSIAPAVCCAKCGSQDTRRIKGWSELFNEANPPPPAPALQPETGPGK